MKRLFLCRAEDLPDKSCRGFELDVSNPPLQLFLVRASDTIYAYRNHCPHTGVNLNWIPDQFMDYSNHYIQCATHGALFRIEDGYCVRGPCAGDALSPVNILLEDENIYLQME